MQFNKKALERQMYNYVADEQTKRLVEYAKQEIVRIATTGEFSNRTYNLIDSYVWVVFCNGKKKGSGYYGKKSASVNSVLHEYSPDISVDVNGRALAQKFVNEYQPAETKGWEIVFAAVAPYGAYLEGGFTFHGKRYQFNVMSQRYDEIKRTLTPLCHVTFHVNQPKY